MDFSLDVYHLPTQHSYTRAGTQFTCFPTFNLLGTAHPHPGLKTWGSSTEKSRPDIYSNLLDVNTVQFGESQEASPAQGSEREELMAGSRKGGIHCQTEARWDKPLSRCQIDLWQPRMTELQGLEWPSLLSEAGRVRWTGLFLLTQQPFFWYRLSCPFRNPWSKCFQWATPSPQLHEKN